MNYKENDKGAELFQEHFHLFLEKLCAFNPEFLPLGTGCCMICKTCSYPDAPCRHPEKMFPCIESYGILVTDLAEKYGISFMNGANVVTWFSLLLYR